MHDIHHVVHHHRLPARTIEQRAQASVAVKRVGALMGAVIRLGCLPLALAGCLWSAGVLARSDPGAYENALRSYEAGDDATAEVQLKNALQSNRAYLPAHILLGEVLLRQGKGAAAEAKFREAARLGADPSLTAEPLARALFQQGKFRELVTTVNADTFRGKERADLLVLRGRALLALERLDDAEAEFASAARAAPESAAPLIGEANTWLHRGKLAEAEKSALRALKLAPNSARAWNMRASVSHAAGNLNAALAAYARAIELDPRYVEARIARAGLLLDLKREAAADADLEVLDKIAPANPRVPYLRALWLARKGDRDDSRKALILATRIVDALRPDYVDSHPPILLVAGLAHYGLAHFERARGYLARYIERFPENVGPRRLLGILYLGRGEVQMAIQVLDPALKFAPNDVQLLATLADAYQRKRRYASAAKLLARALKLSGGSAKLRTQLAMSRLGAGEMERALSELQTAFANTEYRPAGLALAVLHMRRGEYRDADKVARRLLADDPGNLTVLNLLASVQVGLGNRPAAKVLLDRALSLDPEFLPARINLGKLDRMAGRTAAARRRFMDILAQRPDDIESMMELAAVEEADGKPEETLRWLEKARAVSPDAKRPRLKLVDIYLADRKAKKAMVVAQEAASHSPEDLDLLAALARCYVALGKPELARTIYTQMARFAGFNSRKLYRIAKLQSAVRDYDDALYSLEKAINGAPAFTPAQVAAVEVMLAAGKRQLARERAIALRDGHPRLADGYRLVGEVEMRDGRCPEALASLHKAFELAPASALAIRISQAQMICGHGRAAVAELKAWADANPGDLTARKALAEMNLRIGDLRSARRLYEEVLKATPNDGAVLNNLAYLYSRAGDDRALEFARRAHRLAPDSAAAKDTLGWVLVQRGDPGAGLSYLRDAQTRDSRNPEIHYHIAVALDRLGRKQQARAELDAALALGNRFAGIEAARRLRDRLSD